ncbi:MAG: MarR family transcriptional regulator [Peptostreptococcus sp.]|uniref:MarR family winged helix-turn-helix transcriptional regulator n=1 Tax=Peptostreptococcus sp. TaxID=1262 RepID=UPI002FC97D7D
MEETNKKTITENSIEKKENNKLEKNKETLNSVEELDYKDTRKVINDIIVDLFKNILMIEEISLKSRGIKDLSLTEVHAIEAIGSGIGKRMSKVASDLDISLGTLTSTMDKLEKKSYAQRIRSKNDKRVVIARLTAKGELAYKIHRNFHDEMIENLMIDLKLKEDKDLIQVLKNINKFLLKEYGGNNVY